jgi:hypothetical protein
MRVMQRIAWEPPTGLVVAKRRDTVATDFLYCNTALLKRLNFPSVCQGR